MKTYDNMDYAKNYGAYSMPFITANGLNSMAQLAFKLSFLFLLINNSGDYAEWFGTPLNSFYPAAQSSWQSAGTISIFLVFFLSLIRCLLFPQKIVLPTFIWIFLCLFWSYTLIGSLIGFASDVYPGYVIGDARNVILSFGIFTFVDDRHERQYQFINSIVWLMTIIIGFKVLVGMISGAVLFRTISHRYLLKASIFGVPIFAIGLATLLDEKYKKNFCSIMFLTTGTIVIIAANMKGLFLGAIFAAGLILLLSPTRGLLRKIYSFSVIVATAMLPIFFVFSQPIIKFFNAGFSNLDSGTSYRISQIRDLLDRFQARPIFGEGLGSYDIAYEGFRDNFTRPYLVEMEFINILAKTGLIGATLIFMAFFLFICGSSIAVINSKRGKCTSLAIGFIAGLAGLLIASFTNTLFSSILFHQYLLLTMAITKLAVKFKDQSAYKESVV